MTLKFEEGENGVKRLWLSDEFTSLEISQCVTYLSIEVDGRSLSVDMGLGGLLMDVETRKTLPEVDAPTGALLAALGWKPPS